MKRVILVLALIALGATWVMAEDPVAKPTQAPATKLRGEPAVAEFQAIRAATVTEKAADYAPEGGYPKGMEGMSMAYASMMKSGYGKLGKWMGESKAMPSGPSFSIFYEDPAVTEASKLTTKIGFPISADVKGNGDVVIDVIPAMPMAVTLTYQGPYEGAKPAWDAVMKYIPEHQLETAGPGMEVYHTGPGMTQNPADYVTEIRVPVKKSENSKGESGTGPAK